MHKRHFLFGVVSIALGLTLVLSIRSANASFADDYQIYLKTYDNYRRAYDSYVVTRNQYLTFAKSKQSLAVQKLARIHTQLLNLNSSSIDSVDENFNALKFSLFEANQYMHEATNFLTEYKERIKYGNY